MMRQRRGLRACGRVIAWIPLGLALSAMSPVPSCVFETPEQARLRQLYFQQSMQWNPEEALKIQTQIQLNQPYRIDYPNPTDGSRGANEDFRVLLSRPPAP